jgi:methionine biosynthesis protein MetW
MVSTTREFYQNNETDPAALVERHRTMVSLILRDRPNSVLDIGCGRGTLIAALREKAPEISCTGLEVSEALCEMAKAAGIDASVYDLAEPLPFAEGRFDAVILGEVIEHLFDPDAALDDIHRILRPGGRLIVTTPNLACWLNRVLLLAGIQPLFTETSTRKKYGRVFKLLGQGSTLMHGHIRVMTTAALLELLRDRGYSVTDVSGYKFEDLKRNAVTSAIDGFFSRFPNLACGVIAVARKS